MERTREGIFEILVREHQPALLAFVRSCIREHHAAEDLVQDAFVAAWNRLDDYDQSRPFAPWLRGIARNKILEYQRSAATRLRHVSVLAPHQIDAVAGEFERLIPGRGDAMTETMTALKDCIAALPARQRELIHRIYREDQTCRTIAARLEQTIECVKKQLQRVRAKLRDCILGKLAANAADA